MRMHLRGTFCAAAALLMAFVGSALVLSEAGAQAPQAPPPPKVSIMPKGSNLLDMMGSWLKPPAPKVSFVLKDRHGQATPVRTKAAHTGGGNTDVAQPSEDKLIVTMTGVATAGPYPTNETSAGVEFDLHQEFDIVCADPKLTKINLTVEAQIIGLLRGDKHGGSASIGNGAAAVHCGHACVLSVAIAGHAVTGDDNLAINDHKGPMSLAVPAGEYHLTQTFRINAQHARSICGKAAAAEFAPDPTLDPTWISVTDPFRGAYKKEFGFRVILRVEPQ